MYILYFMHGLIGERFPHNFQSLGQIGYMYQYGGVLSLLVNYPEANEIKYLVPGTWYLVCNIHRHISNKKQENIQR